MIERIKRRIRRLLSWQTPTEIVNGMDIGAMISEAMRRGELRAKRDFEEDIQKADRAGTVYADEECRKVVDNGTCCGEDDDE